MTELTQEEKENLQNKSLIAIERVAKLHGKTLANTPKEEFSIMFDCLIAGVTLWRDILIEQEALARKNEDNLEF